MQGEKNRHHFPWFEIFCRPLWSMALQQATVSRGLSDEEEGRIEVWSSPMIRLSLAIWFVAARDVGWASQQPALPSTSLTEADSAKNGKAEI